MLVCREAHSPNKVLNQVSTVQASWKYPESFVGKFEKAFDFKRHFLVLLLHFTGIRVRFRALDNA